MKMHEAIRISRLSKEYCSPWSRRRTLAVKDVSFEVAAGEAFGFIGPNGAGKSTTIKMLTGVLYPTAGEMALFGVPVGRPESRRGLGYVPENPYLYDYLTPLEILTMSLHLHSVKVPNRRRHCMAWLERLELAAVADKVIRSFSKGMTQRVAVAQALCINPRLLILDEPLSGLDPVGRRDVVTLLAEYKAQGGTLFFTSHVLHDVEILADRFGLILSGELRAVRSPAEMLGEDDRVQVRSIGHSPVHGMRLEFGERWVADLPRTELWSLLDTLRSSGHVIVEIRPTLSLETAFFKAIGKS